MKNGHEPNAKSTVKRKRQEREREKVNTKKLNKIREKRFPHSIPFDLKYLKWY